MISTILLLLLLVWTFVGLAVIFKVISNSDKKITWRVLLLMGPIPIIAFSGLIAVHYAYEGLMNWAFNDDKS